MVVRDVLPNGLRLLTESIAVAGGNHTVYAQARDGAGNYSAALGSPLTVLAAVADTRAVTANGSATQTVNVAAPGLLSNDAPIGAAGRAATLASAPVRLSGAGAGTLSVSCPATLGVPAVPAIGADTVCTNGAFRLTLNGVGNNNNARRLSKLGTFSFTYAETMNGVTTPPATVTVTVN